MPRGLEGPRPWTDLGLRSRAATRFRRASSLCDLVAFEVGQMGGCAGHCRRARYAGRGGRSIAGRDTRGACCSWIGRLRRSIRGQVRATCWWPRRHTAEGPDGEVWEGLRLGFGGLRIVLRVVRSGGVSRCLIV